MRKPLNNLLSQVGIKTHNMHPVPQQLCVDTRRRYLCIHAKKKKKKNFYTAIRTSEKQYKIHTIRRHHLIVKH